MSYGENENNYNNVFQEYGGKNSKNIFLMNKPLWVNELRKKLW